MSVITERLDWIEHKTLSHVDPADLSEVILRAHTAIECLIEAARSHTTTGTKDMAAAIVYAERVQALIYKTDV